MSTAWRSLPNPNQWQVTPETARLLQHWRHHGSKLARSSARSRRSRPRSGSTEVASAARARQAPRSATHLRGANEEANPELFRIALKLATGAGKTTVMAMLIAWQTVNAVRHPGSTTLLPRLSWSSRPASRSRIGCASCCRTTRTAITASRELVPERHARRHRQGQDRHHQLPRLPAGASASRCRRPGGRCCRAAAPELNTLETEGQMLQRVLPAS